MRKLVTALAPPTPWGRATIILLLLVSAFAFTGMREARAQPAPLPTAIQAVQQKPAPLGHRFVEGARTPHDIAEIVRCDRDPARGGNPTGVKIINIAKCGRPGMRAHASPNDLVVMLQIADPDEHVTFENLPAYLDTLKEIKGDATRYRSACLKDTTRAKSPTSYLPEMNCNVRSAEPGENVWANPRTNKVVFLQNCTNPVSGPEKPQKCGHIPFYAKRIDTVGRAAETGPSHIESTCWALHRPGDREVHSPWQDLCPTTAQVCDGSDIEAAFGVEIQRMGSFALTEGWYVLDVPIECTQEGSACRVFLCFERWDLSQAPAELRDNPQGLNYDAWVDGLLAYSNPMTAQHSNSTGVRWFDYLPNKYGEMVAPVYYNADEAATYHATTRLSTQCSVLYVRWDADWQQENAAAENCRR